MTWEEQKNRYYACKGYVMQRSKLNDVKKSLPRGVQELIETGKSVNDSAKLLKPEKEDWKIEKCRTTTSRQSETIS